MHRYENKQFYKKKKKKENHFSFLDVVNSPQNKEVNKQEPQRQVGRTSSVSPCTTGGTASSKILYLWVYRLEMMEPVLVGN